MTPVVIDADALNCLRSFGLLEGLEQFVLANATKPEPLRCVGYVARHELNPIQDYIARLQATGVLGVLEIPARSAASEQWRQLRRKYPGIDKGEAEAIAWLLTAEAKLPFVSCDIRARHIANQERLRAWDPLDLVHEWIASGVLSLAAACAKLVAWSDDRGARWRPRDYQGVEATLRQRYGGGYLTRLEER